MRSIFTIHAGEFLFGDYLERSFSGVHIWIPAKDVGIDLIVTDSSNKKIISFQIKFSRDYLLTHMSSEFQRPLRSYGWWKLEREKIKNSLADYWVFVLVAAKRRTHDFVVIKPTALLRRLEAIHGRPRTFQSYLCITEQEQCWETRGLSTHQERQIAEGVFENRQRNFSLYLNDLTMVPGRRRHR